MLLRRVYYLRASLLSSSFDTVITRLFSIFHPIPLLQSPSREFQQTNFLFPLKLIRHLFSHAAIMPSSKVFIVMSEDDLAVLEVCASKACAKAYADASEEPVTIEEYNLTGGTVTVSKPKAVTKAATKAKKSTKTKSTANGEDDDDIPTIPKATKNALKDEVVVFTGELDNMTRKEAQDLAKAAGASTLSAISKNCTLVVVGSKPGEKKLEQIAKLDIDTVSETDFLEMVQKGAAAGFKRASEDEDDEDDDDPVPTKKLKA
ncbi:hypothetical protein BKA81DRAFT_228583 [Phyllosticta paracitricarpa]|uniref:BRCT domain-containing protein n=1 Tax=Phyllosticta citricarpa TaxID=55181 RepID=A0ABR1LHI1_9PEZI